MAQRLPFHDGAARATQRSPDPTHIGMLREFTDRTGTKWRVFDVNPTLVAGELGAEVERDRVHAFPSKAHADGWLCFESASEKRRLAPIPPEWEICDPSRLEEFCGCAGYVSRVSSRRDGPRT